MSIGRFAGGGVTYDRPGGTFLKVYAVHRKSGDHYCLIYEDIVHRKTPVQVVRFRPVADSRMILPNPS